MVSLACGLTPVSFALGLVAGNVSLSLPTWPMRRALRLREEGGEMTDGWFSGAVLTFMTIGLMLLSCFLFFLKNSYRHCLFFFLLFPSFF
jgi:hypothetical protein